MFLRFYGATEQQIDSCLKEMQPYLTDCIDIKRQPLTQSVNAFIPTTPNTEVTLLFKDNASCLAFKDTPATKDIYNTYATPGIASEFVERNHGDPCYGVNS